MFRKLTKKKKIIVSISCAVLLFVSLLAGCTKAALDLKRANNYIILLEQKEKNNENIIKEKESRINGQEKKINEQVNTISKQEKELKRLKDEKDKLSSQISKLNKDVSELKTELTKTNDNQNIKKLSSKEFKNSSSFTITHYCKCSKCCGEWSDEPTASGKWPKEGRTIAVDPKVIPLGTKVNINGQEYIAEDTGSAIKGNRIDVYCDNHSEALSKGKYTANVRY